jgi:hypothetical protein
VQLAWVTSTSTTSFRAGGHATPQSSTRYDHGPVLAFVPNERSLYFAMDLARGYSLSVVEGRSFALAEWAASAEAVNLLTGQAQTSQIPDDVRPDLDFAILDGGRYGWTGRESPGARLSRRPHPYRPSHPSSSRAYVGLRPDVRMASLAEPNGFANFSAVAVSNRRGTDFSERSTELGQSL